jgi:acyl carrier protein
MGRPSVAETTAVVSPNSGAGPEGARQGPARDAGELSGVRLLQHDDVEATVRQLVARHGHPHGQPITMRRPLADLGVDVLALVAIVMNLEQQFDIELDPDEILSWLTAADIVEGVNATLGGWPALS